MHYRIKTNLEFKVQTGEGTVKEIKEQNDGLGFNRTVKTVQFYLKVRAIQTH